MSTDPLKRLQEQFRRHMQYRLATEVAVLYQPDYWREYTEWQRTLKPPDTAEIFTRDSK